MIEGKLTLKELIFRVNNKYIVYIANNKDKAEKDLNILVQSFNSIKTSNIDEFKLKVKEFTNNNYEVLAQDMAISLYKFYEKK